MIKLSMTLLFISITNLFSAGELQYLADHKLGGFASNTYNPNSGLGDTLISIMEEKEKKLVTSKKAKNREREISNAKGSYKKADSPGYYGLKELYWQAKSDASNDFENMKAYRKSCNEEEYFACINLGYAYIHGLGIRQDYKKANQLFKNSCDNNHATGCYNLAISYQYGLGKKKNRAKAKDLYGQSCDEGFQRACDEYSGLNE